MPPKRTYRSRKRTNRRYRKKPAQTSYLSTASKALSLASRVASMVNAEKNHFDYLNGAVIPVTAVIQPLQLIPQGDDTQDRIGRSIKLDGLQMTLQMTAAVAATDWLTARVIVFIDQWSNGAVPVITDLLVSSSVQSFRQRDSVTAKRFKVIMDHNFQLGIPSSSKAESTIKRFFPLKHHIRYINTTGVQAATGAGQVYFTIFANSVTNNAATYAANFRSYYYDN
jgi:hypothetical protein